MKQEKWNYNKAEKINDKYGYSTDVYTGSYSSVINDVCQVWGKTEKECNDRAKFISTSHRMYEALNEINRLSRFNNEDERQLLDRIAKLSGPLLKELDQ